VLLKRILKQNTQSIFGKEHGFSRIQSHTEYTDAVPIRGYDAMEPFIDKLKDGVQSVLTEKEPFMFATTSGTTQSPKLIPVTRSWKELLSALMRIWLGACLRSHPRIFQHKILTVTSPAVEGYTSRNVPMGSVSGLTRMRAPWLIRRNYCIPYSVSELSNYDLRYFVTMRLAMATRVSIMVTPNPSTIIRLAEIAQDQSQTLIDSIHNGQLGVDPSLRASLEPDQRKILDDIESTLVPDPARAGFLESVIREYGSLSPRFIWPELALIGCWLGGSAGIQAAQMKSFFAPELPIRDLGFRATEGTITIPLEDGSASGAIALHANYCEFIPEDEIDNDTPRTLLAHELETGGQYYILLTTTGGLYRYDINDVVEVTGWYKNAPTIAFLRKGRDMVNITGEKLHLNQILAAAKAASDVTNMGWIQLQLIPDTETSRYDLLLEPDDASISKPALEAFVRSFDEKLMVYNIEYEQKRKSDRLHLPRLFHMKTGWSERRRRRDIEHGGKRDAQYKWPVIELVWDGPSRDEVAQEVVSESPTPPSSATPFQEH
jgi:hypothetical protein